MRPVKRLATSFLFLAASAHAADWTAQDLHPKVFQMIQSWISDRKSPVVTEVHLEAMRANRNQFDFDAVSRNGPWIEYRDADSSLLRFRVEAHAGRSWTVVYQENGGGTFTSQSVIRFNLLTRPLQIDGQPAEASVLRVLGIDTR